MAKPITIIGGGLAGLTLGIRLRQLDFPVMVYESGAYPRHRVCGEFISGRGLKVLEEFGLTNLLLSAGGIFSRTAKFFMGTSQSREHEVDPPALCLPRFRMDEVLADHFRGLGGELKQRTRWQGNINDEGIVFATGRRVRPVENGWRWFGMKIHAHGVSLDADLEMYSCRNAYVGVCKLPERKINVCGLFRAKPGSRDVTPMELLKGAAGTPLQTRLAKAVFEESSFCSVAGLSLRPLRGDAQDGCRIGDALTMIPPVTGNGMSMAFEAASLAVEPLMSYSRRELSWKVARHEINQRCDNAFKQRLFWARWVQAIMLSAVFHGKLGGMLTRCDWLWAQFFARTR